MQETLLVEIRNSIKTGNNFNEVLFAKYIFLFVSVLIKSDKCVYEYFLDLCVFNIIYTFM